MTSRALDAAVEAAKAAQRASAEGAAAPRVIVHGADEKPGPGARIVVPRMPSSDASAKLAEGDRAFAAKEFRAALFAYQDAALAQPSSLDALLKAGQAYARLGYDGEAVEMWNRALAIDPANAAALELIAAAHERRAASASRAAPAPAVPAAPATSPARTDVPEDEEGARTHYAPR